MQVTCGRTHEIPNCGKILLPTINCINIGSTDRSIKTDLLIGLFGKILQKTDLLIGLFGIILQPTFKMGKIIKTLAFQAISGEEPYGL